jgi:hypothetical protein
MKTKVRFDFTQSFKLFPKSITVHFVQTLVVFLLLFSFTSSWAQGQPDKEKNWYFLAAPYILFPNMTGEINVKGIPADATANTEDIFTNLDIGGMLYFEANNGKWAIILDGYYVDLGAEGATPLLSRKATMDLKQLAVAVAGMYRLNSWAEAGIGLRVNSVSSTLTIAPGEHILPGSEFSMEETWYDPLIVARIMTRFNGSKWKLGLLADYGGFGIGSDYAYQINPFVSYQISKLLDIGVAYRLDGKKYETGSGTDLFVYDVILHGPSIGLVFNF